MMIVNNRVGGMCKKWLELCGWLMLLFVPPLHSMPSKCDPSLHAQLNRQEKYECLVEKLFDSERYSPLVRPVKNMNETIKVEISVQLSQIVNLDEKNQIMKTNVWLQLYWEDFQLKWKDDPFYQEIGELRINPEFAWRPDVVLFNNADGNYEVSFMSNVVVYSDGSINWIPPAIYKSSCFIDVQYFPFDEQVCELKFGSWTFMEHQLNFTFYHNIPHFDVSDYLESGSWDIVEGGATIQRMPVGQNFKSMVTFVLRLRRKRLFYTVNLIIPCVLISFVTISVFILPADAGEKMTLSISILLALVVFLLLISKILPPSLTIPLISQYLLFTFIMNILAIICTVVVINRNFRTPRTHQMPMWVRYVFLNIFPRLLRMKRPHHEQRWRGKQATKTDKVVDSELRRTGNLRRDPDLTHSAVASSVPKTTLSDIAQSVVGGQIQNLIDSHQPNCRLNDGEDTRQQDTTDTQEPRLHFSPEIYRAADSVLFIQRHQMKDDEYHTVIDDWRYAARVIDRLLLLVFFLVTAVGTLSIFLKAPHVFEHVNQSDILAKYNKNWEIAKSGS
ncbi:hypothetical protein DPMN_103356 [Dreissena polymorpha]|uniref:Uncharacterized protein n=1 Tax=Dreissena polymorpha TaxID=45954 RepID=A0A9D4K0Q7_DREPO|nr:hypothetical protein DPMN_103356 [Dreissena polymorpha]